MGVGCVWSSIDCRAKSDSEAFVGCNAVRMTSDSRALTHAVLRLFLPRLVTFLAVTKSRCHHPCRHLRWRCCPAAARHRRRNWCCCARPFSPLGPCHLAPACLVQCRVCFTPALAPDRHWFQLVFSYLSHLGRCLFHPAMHKAFEIAFLCVNIEARLCFAWGCVRDLMAPGRVGFVLGRRLFHRLPSVHLGRDPFLLATVCFAGVRFAPQGSHFWVHVSSRLCGRKKCACFLRFVALCLSISIPQLIHCHSMFFNSTCSLGPCHAVSRTC